MNNITIAENKEALNRAFADWLVDYIYQALQQQTRFSIALSGGSTPKAIYELLATEPYRSKIPWEKVHFFWGDERDVPFTDEANNARMVYDALFSKIDIPDENIHPIETTIDAAASAANYEDLIKDFFKDAPNFFDITMLGLGADGHTLSLFPGTEIINEQEKLVASFYLPEQNMHRISLTALCANKSKRAAFIVTGSDKAAQIHTLIKGEEFIPAKLIKLENGEIYYFLDSLSAEKL